MALIRIQADLAIPIDVYEAIPADKKQAIRDAIRFLKLLAVKINGGKDNEEMTTRAVYHICRHDEGRPCNQEQEI